MYTRHCEKKIREALEDTPVVVILGPRQTGKTTLAKRLNLPETAYLTLDNATLFNAAKTDPVGFIRGLNKGCTILDEAQRVPELFLAIKEQVDEDRRPGQFLLTGSSNALMLPKLSDSLAGRMEVIHLFPLSTCEIEGVTSTFLEKVLNGTVPTAKNTRIRETLIHKIVAGGFPEPFSRKNNARRAAWYHQYITSIIQKDLKDLGKIEHIDVMPKLVRLLATQVGQLVNFTEIANKLGISRQTVSHYLQLLKQLYLFDTLPSWHNNESKRIVKTPKVNVVDSGLLCDLRRIDEEKIKNNPVIFGHLLENYVVNEITRLATWYNEPIEFYYYRDKDKVEVDLILELYSGQLVGIEVKAAATVTNSDFNGLRRLQSLAGDNFLMGILLYDGDHSIAHAEKLYSVPIGCLWE